MAYLQSTKIEVFPSTKRGTNQKSARLLSESNLVGLINQLLDVDSFVITSVYNESAVFEMNIGGYYFKTTGNVTDITGLFPAANNGQSIVATIQVQPLSDGIYELIGQDSAGEYKSLKFELATTSSTNIRTTNTVSDVTTYTLRILDKIGGVWVIPSASQFKFTTKSMEEIDGGLIV